MRPALPSPPAPPAGPPRAGESAWHPPAETLAAHLHGELPEPEADQVREHVTGCGECIERLLDLDAFERLSGEPEDAGQGAAAAEAERAESWRRLLAERPWDEPAGTAGESASVETVEEEIAAPAPAPRPPAPPPPAPGQPARPPRPGRWYERRHGLLSNGLIAASLAVALLSGLWSLRLLDRLSAPDPDHQIHDLHLGGTRGNGPAGSLEVPLGASFTAVIHLDAETPLPRYEAEILDAGGERIWSGVLRPRDGDHFLSLGLSRLQLSDRRYTLRLRGLDDGLGASAGEYRIEFAE